jgi:hypothetical protein
MLFRCRGNISETESEETFNADFYFHIFFRCRGNESETESDSESHATQESSDTSSGVSSYTSARTRRRSGGRPSWQAAPPPPRVSRLLREPPVDRHTQVTWCCGRVLPSNLPVVHTRSNNLEKDDKDARYFYTMPIFQYRTQENFFYWRSSPY